MGLLDIASLVSHDKHTVEALIQLMQVLNKESLTFGQLLEKTNTKPRYLRFLIKKLRSIEFLRGSKDPSGSYHYYLSYESFSTWCKTKLIDASYNLCKRGGDS